jgi:cobalt-zinc-cadmium efflux system protein
MDRLDHSRSPRQLSCWSRAILRGAWPIFRESLEILLESTPPGVSASNIAGTIEAIPGVDNVHDLHVWAIEPRLVMLTCHVLVDENQPALTSDLLKNIRGRIAQEFRDYPHHHPARNALRP